MINKITETLKQLLADKRVRIACLAIGAIVVLALGARSCSDDSEAVSAAATETTTVVTTAASPDVVETATNANVTNTTSDAGAVSTD